jgi:hypothetical protein
MRFALALAVCVLLGNVQQAAALSLTPSDMINGDLALGGPYGPSNCEVECINTIFGASLIKPDDLLYKADAASGGEEGSLAGSYATVYNGTDATFTYTGGLSANCPACYLAVKDGNANPDYYFYDLANWNGTDAILLTGFWPNQGGFSHISIWGDPDGGDDITLQAVPEPGTLLLVGSALALVSRRLRRQKAVQNI